MKIDSFSLMKSASLLLIGGCIFVACHKPISKKNEINKIEIATVGCLKGCPAIGISIDSSLTYIYYGGYKAKLQGYYIGKVTQGYWDTLNMKLKHFKINKLNTIEHLGGEFEDAEVIFYWDKQKKHHISYVYNYPDSLSHVLIWIANSYKNVELHKLNDSVKFETTYQFMQLPSPKPKIDQVRFPPPKKNRHGKKSNE